MANFRPKLKNMKQMTVYEALRQNREDNRVIRAERTIRAVQEGRRGYGKHR